MRNTVAKLKNSESKQNIPTTTNKKDQSINGGKVCPSINSDLSATKNIAEARNNNTHPTTKNDNPPNTLFPFPLNDKRISQLIIDLEYR